MLLQPPWWQRRDILTLHQHILRAIRMFHLSTFTETIESSGQRPPPHPSGPPLFSPRKMFSIKCLIIVNVSDNERVVDSWGNAGFTFFSDFSFPSSFHSLVVDSLCVCDQMKHAAGRPVSVTAVKPFWYFILKYLWHHLDTWTLFCKPPHWSWSPLKLHRFNKSKI